MAMPQGNVVISDKMQFQSGGAGSGAGDIHHRQWIPDERDGFISWLRGEFAAANAIIDSLCHHIRVVGDPGEYDGVIGCIQQRRCNWNHVLHMQQYFPIAEVMFSLQQVAWRRQQRYFDQAKISGKEFKRSGMQGLSSRVGQKVESAKESYNSSVDSHNCEANSSVNIVGVEKVAEKGEATKPAVDGVKSDETAISNEEKGNDGVYFELPLLCATLPFKFNQQMLMDSIVTFPTLNILIFTSHYQFPCSQMAEYSFLRES